MFSQRLPLVAASRGVPPPWAVRTVRCCVVGLLALPLVVPLLLATTSTFDHADLLRRIGFYTAVTVWLVLFATAQYLTTVFPPVPRRR